MLEPGISLAAWIDTKFLPGAMWQKNLGSRGNSQYISFLRFRNIRYGSGAPVARETGKERQSNLPDDWWFCLYKIKIGGAPLNDHFLTLFLGVRPSPQLWSMIYALLFVMINFIPALILYRKKIFIKL